MPDYNPVEMKATQDALKQRKKILVDNFLVFRQGLAEKLEFFTKEGVEKGLDGVKRLEKRSDTKELLEMYFSINNFDLVLVATDEAYFTSDDDKSLVKQLSAKAFVFHTGNDDNTPHVEINFQENEQGAIYSYFAYWFALSGQRFLSGPRPAPPIKCKFAGESTANLIINHFNRFSTIWSEKPTLGMMLQGRGNKRQFGFPIPNEE